MASLDYQFSPYGHATKAGISDALLQDILLDNPAADFGTTQSLHTYPTRLIFSSMLCTSLLLQAKQLAKFWRSGLMYCILHAKSPDGIGLREGSGVWHYLCIEKRKKAPLHLMSTWIEYGNPGKHHHRMKVRLKWTIWYTIHNHVHSWSNCFSVGSYINGNSDTNFEIRKPCWRFDWMLRLH